MQGKRDSNSHERFWRPSYCHCMIPLDTVNLYHNPLLRVNEKIHAGKRYSVLEKYNYVDTGFYKKE